MLFSASCLIFNILHFQKFGATMLVLIWSFPSGYIHYLTSIFFLKLFPCFAWKQREKRPKALSRTSRTGLGVEKKNSFSLRFRVSMHTPSYPLSHMWKVTKLKGRYLRSLVVPESRSKDFTYWKAVQVCINSLAEGRSWNHRHLPGLFMVSLNQREQKTFP